MIQKNQTRAPGVDTFNTPGEPAAKVVMVNASAKKERSNGGDLARMLRAASSIQSGQNGISTARIGKREAAIRETVKRLRVQSSEL